MMKRPLLKTLTFAILHFLTAFAVVYALTGSFAIGGAVALIEPLCNTVVFYFHEKIWQRFGDRKAEQSDSYGHDVILRYISHNHNNEDKSSSTDNYRPPR